MSNNLTGLALRYKESYDSVFSRLPKEMQDKVMASRGKDKYDYEVKSFYVAVAELAESDTAIKKPFVAVAPVTGNPS